MIGRRDLERIAQDRRPRMRRRPQTDGLRAKIDRTVVFVVRDVVQCDVDRHGVRYSSSFFEQNTAGDRDQALTTGKGCLRKVRIAPLRVAVSGVSAVYAAEVSRCKNCVTSRRSVSTSPWTRSEALLTRLATRPVSAAGSLMPVTLEDTCEVPAEASWTLRAISRVACPCCSIEAAIASVMPLISAMVCVI